MTGCCTVSARRADADEARPASVTGSPDGIRDDLAVLVGHVPLAEHRRDHEGHLVAVAHDDHVDGLVGVVADDRGGLVPRRRSAGRRPRRCGRPVRCPRRHPAPPGRRARTSGVRSSRGARTPRPSRRSSTACATPNPMSSTPNSTTASTRFMNGPPNMIDDALPDGQPVEGAVLVAGRDRLHAGVAGVLHEAAEESGRVLVHLLALGGREHADHRDVAAERDRLHAVLGLALALRPDASARSRSCTGSP